jgi:transcriptional regulator with XRE-family HTH domain
MDLGHRVRDLRNARRLSQVELAAQAGVARNTLNRIENGHLMPTAPVIEHLAEALDVAPGALFEEPGPAGKAAAPTEAGPSAKSEEERRSGYLRAWRAFVYKLVQRWEQDPPKSSREIAVVLDTMQDLLEEGAFERPPEQVTTSDKREASEWLDLSLLFRGIDRLNQIEIVDTVEEMTDTTQGMAEAARADAEAERLRATFREIKGQLAG